MSLERFSLEGRIALISGASSGIGHVLAKGLAAAGATVIVTARRMERLEALVSEITAAGGRAVAIAMDVSDRESVAHAFAQAEAEIGVVDVIINNAGISEPALFERVEQASLDRVMQTNFYGVWHVAQEGARRLIAAGAQGSIVNVSSVLGLMAKRGLSSYCASKGAVVQLTRGMALDLARYGIRVNTLAPGWFKTEMNAALFDAPEGREYIKSMPARRLGDLEELVGPVVLLASEAGSFINGAVIPVDGAIGAGEM